ncbi:MAG: sulfatase-like hydrolase/transferase, partial [Bacteroidales bacterium]|nr:sulfatase-like hydrolase/transferase [Bacteroidales bacterium]
FSKKLAWILSALFLSLILILEISLSIFSVKSGALMDGELLLRPWSEVWLTIKNGIPNLALTIIAYLVIVSLFFGLSFLVEKKFRCPKVLSVFMLSIMALSIPSIFLIREIEDVEKPNAKTYIVGKVWYFVRNAATCGDISQGNYPYDKDIIEKYISYNQNSEIADSNFPMERLDNTQDVLSGYFDSSEAKPNIVMLVVESLGCEWLENSNFNEPVMPFLDSLSQKSLYWKNCLSTTQRSFGAVPAVTGSVPCGIRGYQFGNMPENNTLISVLRDNGYKANAFYSGLFYFDCIAEYLISQKIDYMSNFYADYENDEDKNKGCFWGYHDEFLLEKTMDVLNAENSDGSPLLNLIVTISTHDLIDENNPVFAEAVKTAKAIRESVRGERKISDGEYQRMIGFVYVDKAIREFFASYSQRADFKNTIFVITGDHASGYFQENDMSKYHVPLMIYSPMLNKSQTFASLVTHNDIVPSLVALLKNKYGLKTPEKVSWAGKGLSADDSSNSEMMFVEYAKGITKMLSGNMLYSNENNKVYELFDGTCMKECESQEIIESMKAKYDAYKYVYSYSYLNNRLCSCPIYSRDSYQTITEYSHKDEILCKTSDDKKWISYYLLPETPIENNYSKVRITINADVSFLDELDADDYMDLYFYCSGDNHAFPYYYTDKIVKFISSEEIVPEQWYKLNISKEFQVLNEPNLKCYIYTYYSKWMESNRAVFKNISINIEGCE